MPSDEETVRLSISLPAKLLREMDRRVTGRGYSSRSEFVRDLIREKMIEKKWSEGKEEVVGVLTISFDHHQRELTNRLTEIQHRRFVNVLCSTHVHLGHDHCLEAIILKGRPSAVEKLALEIGGLKGVRYAGLTRALGGG
jgi:CopG family nickel-responsive transcriptional regulator